MSLGKAVASIAAAAADWPFITAAPSPAEQPRQIRVHHARSEVGLKPFANEHIAGNKKKQNKKTQGGPFDDSLGYYRSLDGRLIINHAD